jgi:alkanesulfonate monooxygenase
MTTPPPCEISWFSALCDDDYEFLGVPDPMLRSSWEHCRDIVMQADASGFDNILLPSGYALGIDTTAFAAAIAPMIKRMRLLMAVRIGEMWLPQLARQIATIDRMLGGRLTINIISSDLPGETLASAPRYARTVEAMAILKQMLNGQPIDHQGEFYKLKLDPPRIGTLSGRAPAFYFGGLSEDAREAAAAGCDVFLMWPDRREVVAAIIADMTARAARHGRTLRFGYRAHVIVRDTEAEARHAADRLLSKLDAAQGAAIRAKSLDSNSARPGRLARAGQRRRLCRATSVDRRRPRPLRLWGRDRRRPRPGARQVAGLSGDGDRRVHPVRLPARRRGRSVRAPCAAAHRSRGVGGGLIPRERAPGLLPAMSQPQCELALQARIATSSLVPSWPMAHSRSWSCGKSGRR